MSNFAVTFFFEGVQAATFGVSAALGWTETWYVQSATLDTCFGEFDVREYLRRRILCLSERYRIAFIRVAEVNDTDAGGLRRVKIQTLINEVGAIKGSTAAGKGAQVQCAILVNLMRLPTATGEKVHDRRFLVRGLPVSVIDGNVLKTDGPYWTRFTNFFNFIAKRPTGVAPVGDSATSLGIRYQNPAVTGISLLTASVNTRDRHLIDVTPTFPGALKGTNYKIKGVGGQDGPNVDRQWVQLTDSGATPMVLGKTRNPFPEGRDVLYIGPGLAAIRKVAYLYGPFDQYAIIGLRSKRTGKISRQLRGKS